MGAAAAVVGVGLATSIGGSVMQNRAQKKAAGQARDAEARRVATEQQAQYDNNRMYFMSLGYSPDQLDASGLPTGRVNTRYFNMDGLDEQALFNEDKALYDSMGPVTMDQFEDALARGEPLREGARGAYEELLSGQNLETNLGLVDRFESEGARAIDTRSEGNEEALRRYLDDRGLALENFGEDRQGSLDQLAAERESALASRELALQDAYDEVIQNSMLSQARQGMSPSAASNPYAVQALFDRAGDIGQARATTRLQTAGDQRTLTDDQAGRRLGLSDDGTSRGLADSRMDSQAQFDLTNAVVGQRNQAVLGDQSQRLQAAPQALALADSYYNQLVKPYQAAAQAQAAKRGVLDPWLHGGVRAPTQRGITPDYIPSPSFDWGGVMKSAGGAMTGMIEGGTFDGMFGGGTKTQQFNPTGQFAAGGGYIKRNVPTPANPHTADYSQYMKF